MRTRRALTLFSLLLVVANLRAAPDLSAPIQLSPFEVLAERMEFEHWHKITSPNFVVYTDARSKRATELVRQMEMVHQAAQFYLRRKGLALAPRIVVLPTSRSDWRKFASRGGVEWKVAVSGLGKIRPIVLVEHDWANGGLGSLWSILMMQLAEAMNLHGPLWFKEGLGSFFSTVRFKGDTLTLGTQGYHAAPIRVLGWLDWPTFFKVTRSSERYRKDGDAVDQYFGQCGVFAHFVMTHPEPEWTQRYLGWAAYLHAGNEPTEEAFQQHFGRDFATCQKEIGAMLAGGKYRTGTITFPPAALQFPITTVRPPDREMKDLFVLAQIMNQRTPDSDASLDAALAQGVRSERLRELLADACLSRGREAEALAVLQEVIATGTDNPMAFAEAAGLSFAAAVGKLTLETRLGPEAAGIREGCERALAIEPRLVLASETLAWTEALGTEVQEENMATIVRICRALEGHAATDRALAALAVARWRTGAADSARGLAERLLGSPFSRSSTKALMTQLLVRLEPVEENTDGGVASAR